MGHSLFALMSRVPLDLVRVDLTTLAARDEGDHAMQVLRAIAHLTESFGIGVVSGGIRTPQLKEAAVAAGAALLHGRALPHDMTVDEVRARLDDVVPA
jgi:EAL domain-containing protein (putative c-di-GMP-specific phosphodiesterase class I)